MFYKTCAIFIVTFFAIALSPTKALSHGNGMSINPTNGSIYSVDPNYGSLVKIGAYAGAKANCYWSADLEQTLLLALVGNPSGTARGVLSGSCGGSSFNDRSTLTLPRAVIKTVRLSDSQWPTVSVDAAGSTPSTRTSSGSASWTVTYPRVTWASLIPSVTYHTKSAASTSHSHNFYVIHTSGSGSGSQ